MEACNVSVYRNSDSDNEKLTQDEYKKPMSNLIEANEQRNSQSVLPAYEVWVDQTDFLAKIHSILFLLKNVDVIKGAHIALGHVGRDKLLKETNKKYANIGTLNLLKFPCAQ